jgi:hypothetical protein
MWPYISTDLMLQAGQLAHDYVSPYLVRGPDPPRGNGKMDNSVDDVANLSVMIMRGDRAG